MTRKEQGLLILLAILCGLAAIGNPQFLSASNIQNMSRLVGIYGIFSIGVGIVIITGGIDLSVGSMFALLGVALSIMLVDWQWAVLPAVATILAIGALLGTLHGFLVTRVRLQPFIVTLCGLLLYRGLARYAADDTTKGFGSGEGFAGFRDLVTGTFLGLPASLLALIVVAVAAWVVLERSAYGRYVFAVGRNEEASRYAGVDSRSVVTFAYVGSGALAGVAAIFLAFYTNSVSPSSHGNFYELYAIAAAVLGGCSLRGGEGSILGIVIGTILLQVLRNLVVLLDIPGSLDFAVMGAVILVGVVADQVLGSRSEGRRLRPDSQ